jgi:hypothetical protein
MAEVAVQTDHSVHGRFHRVLRQHCEGHRVVAGLRPGADEVPDAAAGLETVGGIVGGGPLADFAVEGRQDLVAGQAAAISWRST